MVEPGQTSGPEPFEEFYLVVLARDRTAGAWPDDAVEDLWQEEQDALAELSTRGERVVAIGAGFRLGLDRPDLVVEAVHRVASAAD